MSDSGHPHAHGETDSPLIGIGALAAATGVPESTLRTWERRYGYPQPARTAGNHRLYAGDTIERLLWVQRAIDHGHRPGAALKMTPTRLRELIEQVAPPPAPERAETNPSVPSASGAAWEGWLGAVERLDEFGLTRLMRLEWNRVGTLDFIERRLAPMLFEVGELWARGRLSVAQEHFAAERAQDFLAALWRPLSAAHSRPVVVLATLPGEQHVLGLHMAACAAAMDGAHVVFLGLGLPIDDVVHAVRVSHADGLIVSVSSGPARESAASSLRTLREKLAGTVPLLVGGSGAGEGAARLRDVGPWVTELLQ